MKLSIVIPTKNEGKYIGPTIAQFEPYLEKYKLEIIISDADSRDETAAVVREYQKRLGDRLKFVQSRGKQNIAIGRNLGAAQATGDILFHTDADVRIPRMDRFFTRIFSRFENSGTVAATVPIWVYPEESGLMDKLYHILMNGVIRLSFTAGVYLAKGECQLVRRSVFERIGGYNETIVAGEDCNLFYRLHKEGKVAYFYRLAVHHSPRRFREYGYMRLSFIYLREGLSLLFLRKSYMKEWTPVR
ncbi:MAG: glycosyltransferase [Lewinellaceae bacterium]|nr:glycosyltransferase [Saprospiraceae bacterium]MCB9306567.1 glycosyltransferase [Lewinellaceae bacterium]MCB9355359.1 glycosyltransferase [Lewinellaceae bacterium]